MTSYKIKTYAPGDVFNLDAIEKEFDLREQDSLALSRNVNAYSVFDRGRIVAVFGFSRIFAHSYELWTLLSAELRETPLATCKVCKNVLRSIPVATRIQMTTRADLRCGERWAKFLGFEKEGVMKRYGPDGADHILYARIS